MTRFFCAHVLVVVHGVWRGRLSGGLFLFWRRLKLLKNSDQNALRNEEADGPGQRLSTHRGPEPVAKRRFMSVRQLAERWGISKAHCYRLVESGALPSLHAGSAIRLWISGVEAAEREGRT